jgi:rhodanese-related sulfurtransferase/CBS domain-containing protein
VPKQIDTIDVQALLERGAVLIEVLPASAYDAEHLPGARNVPFPSLGPEAVAELDHTTPTIAYCYDHECDLSARAAHRLESLGFTDVYDYGPSKVAWLACGLPVEGTVPATSRAGAIAREATTCPLDSTVADIADVLGREPRVVVTTDEGVVLGVVRPEARTVAAATPIDQVMQGAPPSVRPSITASELAESMDEDARTFVLVTTPDGTLLGMIERADLFGPA